MGKQIDIKVPEILMRKLSAFAKEELSKEEIAVLNSIFDVFRFAMEHKCTLFKDEPDFIKEIINLENEGDAQVAITPTITLTTTITITTTLASHPVITCAAAIRECDKGTA